MNIWNPGAINLTDNQIYETCDDLLDGENHYCTPVPSRQTSGVLSTVPLTSASSETSSRYRPTAKCAGVCVIFIFLLILSFVAIGCGGYALFEIQRLQGEVETLRGEIDTIHMALRGDSVSLNESLSVEVQAQSARLAELKSSLQFALSGLEQQVAENFTLLMADIQMEYSFLSTDVQKNLTLLANISSLELAELANNVRMNVTTVVNELEYLENQTEMRFNYLQSTIDRNISSLEAHMEEGLEQFADLTVERLNILNSSLVEELNRLEAEIFTLERSTLLNISQLLANHKSDFEHLSSEISLLKTNVADLTSTTLQSSNDLQAAISSLSEETYSNISSLKNSTTILVTSLSDELSRVEVELSLEAHGNISQLNLDLRERLGDVSTTCQERVSDLEEETESTFANFNNQTDIRFTNLDNELQSNLTSLRLFAIQEVTALANQTLNYLEHIEDNIREDLGTLSGITYQNLTTLSTVTEQWFMEFENDTISSLSDARAAEEEARVLLNQTVLETARNLAESRHEFEQNILQLRGEIQANFEDLNLSDSEILNRLQALDSRVRNTSEELNRTENMLVLLISSETSSLRISLAHVEDDLSNVTSQVQNISHLLQEGFNSTDILLLNLQHSLHLLATESFENITRLIVADEALGMDLEELAEATRHNISDSVAILRTDIQSMLDITSANLTQLENDVTENFRLLNSSLHLEILDFSSTVSGSVAMLTTDISNALLGVYSYINSSIDDIGIQLEILNATILGLEITLNATSMDVTMLQALANNTIGLVIELKSNVTVMNFELAQDITSAFRDINSNLNDSLLSLEMATYTNLTNVENGLSYQLQRIENETRADIASSRHETEQGIENLRSAVYSNITSSSINLSQALHDLNVSFLNVLELSIMESMNSLSQVEQNTKTNLSLLRSELGVVSLNVSELMGQAENFIDLQASTSLRINSLNSSICNLGQKLDATRGNVTEVTNELELLDGTVRTHLNSTVDLFGGCREEVSNCFYTPNSTEYQRGCDTPKMAINVTVSQIMSVPELRS